MGAQTPVQSRLLLTNLAQQASEARRSGGGPGVPEACDPEPEACWEAKRIRRRDAHPQYVNRLMLAASIWRPEPLITPTLPSTWLH